MYISILNSLRVVMTEIINYSPQLGNSARCLLLNKHIDFYSICPVRNRFYQTNRCEDVVMFLFIIFIFTLLLYLVGCPTESSKLFCDCIYFVGVWSFWIEISTRVFLKNFPITFLDIGHKSEEGFSPSVRLNQAIKCLLAPQCSLSERITAGRFTVT